MIYLNPKAESRVRYCLQQSLQGHHIFFPADLLKRAVCAPLAVTLDYEAAYRAEPHLERALEADSLSEGRAYLESLDDATLSDVVRTYLFWIESCLHSSGARH